jgi:uncharacterized protein YbaP (TraB family)
MKIFGRLMCSMLLWTPAITMAEQTSPGTPVTQNPPQAMDARNLNPVTVVGVVPGPGMWRVRKGRHVLWILGTLDELPEKMQWRAREVRQVVAQADEVLDVPRVSIHASIDYFDRLALNPEGRKLRDVVSPQDYEKWLAIKAIHLGDDEDIEDRRPIYAAIQLYVTSLKRAGLSSDMIEPVIDDLLKQRGLMLTPVIYREDADRNGDPMGDIHVMPTMELACFEATMNHLDDDLGIMQQRAMAWSSGDLDDLAKLPMSDELDKCRDTLLASGASFNPDIAFIHARLRDTWISAARNAIASHKVSFAMLPMADLFGPDSYLEKLRVKGYRVDLPDGLGDN